MINSRGAKIREGTSAGIAPEIFFALIASSAHYARGRRRRRRRRRGRCAHARTRAARLS
jgi:hypothetical protein